MRAVPTGGFRQALTRTMSLEAFVRPGRGAEWVNGFAIEDGLMGQLRTLLLAIATMAVSTVAVSTVAVQAADLETGLRAVHHASHYHRHQWQRQLSGRCAFVEGGNPLTVPFFAGGWSPGPTYLLGWQRCTCCAVAEPVVSVNY